ncbi:hypothetical protein BCR34DRAFT_499754, partial [Clohesyomyces aquaticus]
GAESKIQLETIVACENWALVQSARVSELHESTAKWMQLGKFDSAQAENVASSINMEIESGLAAPVMDAIEANAVQDPATLITRMFAHMVTIYLHLVMYGFHHQHIVGMAISDALAILKAEFTARHFPVLIAPVFILGVVAEPSDQHFFRNIFSRPPILDPFFQHRVRMLPVLEKIWVRRSDEAAFAWKDCVELAKDILLV